MGKQLELHFLTEMGRTIRLIVQEPKEGLTEAEIAQSMQAIIDSDAFYTSSGPLVAMKEARLIERDMTVFEFTE